MASTLAVKPFVPATSSCRVPRSSSRSSRAPLVVRAGGDAEVAPALSRRALVGLLAAAPVLLSASRALALIPDDDDEELIEKARSNRKSRLASERVAEQKFSRTANGVGECTHCCRVLRACRAAKTASQPS